MNPTIVLVCEHGDKDSLRVKAACGTPELAQKFASLLGPGNFPLKVEVLMDDSLIPTAKYQVAAEMLVKVFSAHEDGCGVAKFPDGSFTNEFALNGAKEGDEVKVRILEIKYVGFGINQLVYYYVCERVENL